MNKDIKTIKDLRDLVAIRTIPGNSLMQLYKNDRGQADTEPTTLQDSDLNKLILKLLEDIQIKEEIISELKKSKKEYQIACDHLITENNKLKSMIDNGLGWADLIDDTKPY